MTLYTGATEQTTVGVDFGDGSAGQTQDSTGGGTLEFTHAYADAGDYTLTFTATDPSGDTSTATGTVTVADAEQDAGPDRATAEGGSVPFGGPSTPPDEFTTVTWDFGDGSDPATGVEQEHVYRNDGEFTATVSVTDDKGTVSDTAKVTVTNVAPEADVVAPVSAGVGETVAIAASPAIPAPTSTRSPGRSGTADRFREEGRARLRGTGHLHRRAGRR